MVGAPGFVVEPAEKWRGLKRQRYDEMPHVDFIRQVRSSTQKPSKENDVDIENECCDVCDSDVHTIISLHEIFSKRVL